MSIRVIVNGATGKMGSLACETILKHSEFELVGQLSRKDDLRSVIARTNAQIVVDLTRADCVYDNSLAIVESGAHPVIGSSGLTDAQIQFLTEYCEKRELGGIIVPNFSISAVLMMRFAAEAAAYMPEVEIIEAHHQQKFDAPSGTALKTAELIAKNRKVQTETISKESIPGVRGGKYLEISIHSLRLPGVLARQQVIFGNTGETLTIAQDSIDRICYMPGLLLCCRRVMSLSGLYFGLEHLLS
jgi:4-hydroxy-tetrahydrodipicolinate reductase